MLDLIKIIVDIRKYNSRVYAAFNKHTNYYRKVKLLSAKTYSQGTAENFLRQNRKFN